MRSLRDHELAGECPAPASLGMREARGAGRQLLRFGSGSELRAVEHGRYSSGPSVDAAPCSDARSSADEQGHFIQGSNRGASETTIGRPAPLRQI
jgi:hypothetical protein